MPSRPEFITETDYKLLKEKYEDDELSRVLEKIKNDYPVQYAIGNVEFLNTIINVDERVLIPRFATELLVDKLKKYIEKYNLENSNILDIATGSGCIAIALKKAFKSSFVDAVDISLDALSLAKENANFNKTSINFMEDDILNTKLDQKYSVIVSNPPYVKNDEYTSPNTKYEPRIALYPGIDDLIFYKSILKESTRLTEEKNIIAFEIGSEQGEDILNLAKSYYPNSIVSLEKDLEGFDRYIFIFNNCE